MNLRILVFTNNPEVVGRRIVTQRQLDSNSFCFDAIQVEMKSVTIADGKCENNLQKILSVRNSVIHV